MNWSALTSLADTLQRRPTWLEQDGDELVPVHGFSILDNLFFGTLAAVPILVTAIYFLVTIP